MSRIILVSLISDQAIPNVLFIKDQPKADLYVFISTEQMERKGVVGHIIKACEDQIEVHQTILVEEDSLVDFEKTISIELESQDEDHYLVNITGGTKIMSLGAFNYFTKIGASDIYYLPIGKSHFRQIFPMKKNKTKEILFRISLIDYLEANGVAVQQKAFSQKNQLIRSKADNEKVMTSFLGELNLPIKKMVEFFRQNKIRDSKNTEITDELLNVLHPMTLAGFKAENEHKLTREETNYLTGDWFEEYTYELIKSTLNKKEEEIGKGVRVTRGEKTSNEFDVMFTHENALYVIECKTDVADDEEGKLSQLFTNTLYKASTLKKDFGLFVKYFLFSVNDFSKLSQEHQDRARVLDIKLVGTEILSEEEKLKEFILTM
ncbi:Card1-like endonuclease domain-containing protein [Algoriphagus sp.]|uniref:Card1-like endonuclease domain-containing protein n=1 Tax=Algoriphagus sp. TaxID=1872435 RepID=UPI00391DCC6C